MSFRPEYLVMHHSLSVDGAVADIAAFRKFHTDPVPAGRGWRDIAYHAVVEQVGAEYEVLIGRPWDEIGAHAPGYNDKSLGICLAGNFDVTPPPPAQLRRAALFCQWLSALYQIPHTHIIGHRDATPHRTCPGAHFDLPAFRALVESARW